MIRAAMVALWGVVLAAATSWYFSLQTPQAQDVDTGPQKKLEVFDLDTTSIPVIRNNEVRGYLLVSAVFTISSEISSSLPFPVELEIRDGLFEALFSDRELDIFQLDKLDIQKTKDGIKRRINEKYPDLVEDIKLKYFDFMTKDEVRDMQMRRY